MTTFINLTPYEVVLNNGTKFPAVSPAARVSATYTDFDEDGISTQVFGEREI